MREGAASFHSLTNYAIEDEAHHVQIPQSELLRRRVGDNLIGIHHILIQLIQQSVADRPLLDHRGWVGVRHGHGYALGRRQPASGELSFFQLRAQLPWWWEIGVRGQGPGLCEARRLEGADWGTNSPRSDEQKRQDEADFTDHSPPVARPGKNPANGWGAGEPYPRDLFRTRSTQARKHRVLAERLTLLPDSNRRTGFGIMQAAGKVIGGGRQLSPPSMLLRPQCRLDATIETSPASEIAARLVLSLKKYQ